MWLIVALGEAKMRQKPMMRSDEAEKAVRDKERKRKGKTGAPHADFVTVCGTLVVLIRNSIDGRSIASAATGQ